MARRGSRTTATTAALLVVAFTAPAHAAALDPRCITVKDVVIVGGAEAWADKKLCKSPGSARYDVIEVAQAVYGAASTQAAFEKASDPQLRELRGQIETLRAQVAKAGDKAANARLALLSAQGRFIAGLAGKDRGYAEAIAQFRSSVVDIAATPEGAASLAQYNGGDEIGALAILDKLRAANDAARQTHSNIASAAEGRRIAKLALDARNKGKLSTATVIARYEDVTRLDPGVFQDWSDLNQLYQDAGRLSEARHAVKSALATAQSEYDHAISLVDLGDILKLQGDLPGAERAYVESVASFRKLASAEPDNFRFLKYRAYSLQRIGYVRMRQGDLTGADVAYAESLSFGRNLAASYPEISEPQRFVSVVLDEIGNLREAQGNQQAAYNAYSESLVISRKLAAADPDNVIALIDLSIGLQRAGSMLKMLKDLAGAQAAYDEGLVIARKAAAADLSYVNAQANVAKNLKGIGALYFSQNNLADAETAYGDAITITRKLASAESGDEYAQRDHCSTLIKLGEVRFARNDLPGTDKAYDESLLLIRRMAEKDSANAKIRHDLSATLGRIARLRISQKDLDDAGKINKEEIYILRNIVENKTNTSHNQNDLANALETNSSIFSAKNELALAQRALGESLQIRRTLAAGNPSSRSAQRELAITLIKSARTRSLGVHWRDVVAQWRLVNTLSALNETERKILDAAIKEEALEPGG